MSNPRTVLVTGADGQLGRDVMAACAASAVPAVGLGRAELDVADGAMTTAVIERLQPAAIIHCAAWTDVDGAEEHPDQALRVNADGCAHVAAAARSVDAYLVAVSTDYVFDGSRPEGYSEDAPVAPLNEYGRSKLAGERHVLAYEHGCVARSSWLFGGHGSNFVRTIARLASARDSLDVVDDQHGCPTWTTNLAHALLACVRERPTGILHLVDGPPTTWFGLARAVVEHLGVACEVRPVSSEAFRRPATRPAHSVLRATRPDTPPMGSWSAGLDAALPAIAATATQR